MQLRFWGTRGSIATPGASTLRYGGNTSCVEAVTKAGRRFIFDCGTGARPLGGWLMGNAPKPITATLLLSHTHWDHIQGFPFFVPLFVPGSKLTVCGPHGAKSSLPEVLSGQMEYTYFPVELAQLGAEIRYEDLNEGFREIDGVRIGTQLLNHPAVALGYRLEADGVSLLYLCDHEPYWESLWHSGAEPGKLESILHEGDRRHAAFMRDADVVIHDSQYTPEEYPSKKNWGHSTWSYVTGIAVAAGVKRLFLTHHDPTHDDAFLDRIEADAREFARSLGSSIEISCAREGFEATFEGAQRTIATASPSVPVPETAQPDSLLILIVDDDEDLRLLARRALVRGGHRVLEASGGAEGLDMIASRADESARRLPIIVLTAHGDESKAQESFELGATDFLAKPFTPPQLDARVRSCFAHAPRN